MRDASTLSCPERRGEGDYKYGRCSIIAIAIHPSNLGFQLEITKAGSSNNNNTHNTDNGIDQVWSKLEPEMKQRQRNINPINFIAISSTGGDQQGGSKQVFRNRKRRKVLVTSAGDGFQWLTEINGDMPGRQWTTRKTTKEQKMKHLSNLTICLLVNK